MTPPSRPPSASTVLEDADLTQLAGLKLGNYRLERLVGRGRMGVVYLAKDEALLRPTAIKILSWRVAEAQGQDPIQWFLTEARLVARINHPLVVQIYGAARHADHCYIAMEYVPGTSAETAVAQHGRMAPEAATDVLLQAASALQAAHQSGVVHRDVKPANLLMRADGVTKLGDFGMALGSAEFRTGTAHLRVGTPYYTAPEIWRGEAAGASSDLYSLAATYFHLLTGRPPYPSHDMAAVEQAHLRAAVPDPREVIPTLPVSCTALVRRALAKTPRERHGSMRELIWDARRVAQDLAHGSRPAAPAGSAVRPADPSAQVDRPEAKATGPLTEVLGFVRRPFFPVEKEAGPYDGPPFAALREQIAGWLDGSSAALLLTGPASCGKTLCCQQVARDQAPLRTVVSCGPSRETGTQSLVARLCRSAGVADGSEASGLDALVERLGEELRRTGHSPLVILDGAGECPGLGDVVSAALWTRAFQVLLAGSPELSEQLTRAGVDFRDEAPPQLQIPRLDGAQIGAYVSSWLAAARAPGSLPIVLSPDALRLLAFRSRGELGRIDCLAENMLLLAALERRPVVTSWHAWAASERERWSELRTFDALPRRPAVWPPPGVIEVIDDRRREAGAPPWPGQPSTTSDDWETR
jgi:hypothetical protein